MKSCGEIVLNVPIAFHRTNSRKQFNTILEEHRLKHCSQCSLSSHFIRHMTGILIFTTVQSCTFTLFLFRLAISGSGMRMSLFESDSSAAFVSRTLARHLNPVNLLFQ
jgi:hypothetical protein